MKWKKNADKDLAQIKKKLTDSAHAQASPRWLSSAAAQKWGSCVRTLSRARSANAGELTSVRGVLPSRSRIFEEGLRGSQSLLDVPISAWMISLKRLSKKNNAAWGSRGFRWCARCTFGLSLYAPRESVFGKLTREIENVFPLESNESVKFWCLCYAID